MACVPLNPSSLYWSDDLRRVAQILDQLERRAEREDLRALDVLDVVGEACACRRRYVMR